MLPGQDQDLSGTWIGSTDIPNREDRDNLTLVLKKDGASYTGNITDSMGMLNATVLEKVKLEKDTLSFEFLARHRKRADQSQIDAQGERRQAGGFLGIGAG